MSAIATSTSMGISTMNIMSTMGTRDMSIITTMKKVV